MGICRYPTSILAHSAVGIEVLPGPRDTLGRMTWPPRAPAMSGMPDVVRSKVKTKVKSKRGSLWWSGFSDSFPRDTDLELLGAPVISSTLQALQRGHPSGGKNRRPQHEPWIPLCLMAFALSIWDRVGRISSVVFDSSILYDTP